jgi:D-xylose 1-dehydrogenase (NADP+, D-xylono-1,5-lactone-forming)
MPDTLTWGLISTARINRKLIPAIHTSRGNKLIAVASRDRQTAEDYADEYGIPKFYGSYEELLADPKVDCVYNPLPNSMHAEWTIRALEAGKHVLCEKPFTMNVEEAERVAEVSKRTGLLVTEAFMYRFHPQWERVRRMIDSGDLGDIKLVRAQMGGHMNRPGDIRMIPEMGGGALMDVGCYCISACRMVTGSEPEWICATANYENGVDVMMSALMRFHGDVLTEFNCGFRSNPHNDVDIIGTDASVRVKLPWGPAPTEEVELIVNRDNEIERIAISPVDQYRIQVESFCNAVREEEPAPWGVADAIAQMRVVDAVRESAARNEPVAL